MSEQVPNRKRWSCCFIMALCAAMPSLLFLALLIWVVILFNLPVPPLVISEKTTRYTAPLTDKGYIDFFAILEQRFYPPELATDENGFRLFVRQFGDGGDYGSITPEDREFYRRQVYEKLGLDPDVPPTMTLPQPPHEIVEEFKYDHAWTLEDYPMLADWINEIDEPLDAIAEMIRQPVFFGPYLQSPQSVASGKPQNLIDTRLPDVQLCREISRVFTARATYRIGQGNIDGAIKDKLTLHRWGRLTTQKGFLVGYLVGIAIEGMAFALPLNAHPDHPLTEEQIRRVLEGLDALPLRRALVDAYETERLMMLSSIQAIMRAPAEFSEENDIDMNFVGKTVFNWNTVFRRVNEMYDAMQEPPPRIKYYAMQNNLEVLSQRKWKLFAPLLMPGGKDTVMTNMLLAVYMPAIDAFDEIVQRFECAENMQRLALAMMLYQVEHGKLPEGDWLSAIAPYLAGTPAAGVPAKCFSCPSNPSPEGMTTYALLQYGDANGDIVPGSLETILLVELQEPVPFDKAVITADDVLEIPKKYDRRSNPPPHSGGMNVVSRSGAVQFLSANMDREELVRLLGRESE